MRRESCSESAESAQSADYLLKTRNSELETRNSTLYSLPRGAVAQLAERRVRNAEARSSTLLCSTNYFQPFTAAANGGCFAEVANTWTFFWNSNCKT